MEKINYAQRKNRLQKADVEGSIKTRDDERMSKNFFKRLSERKKWILLQIGTPLILQKYKRKWILEILSSVRESSFVLLSKQCSSLSTLVIDVPFPEIWNQWHEITFSNAHQFVTVVVESTMLWQSAQFYRNLITVVAFFWRKKENKI